MVVYTTHDSGGPWLIRVDGRKNWARLSCAFGSEGLCFACMLVSNRTAEAGVACVFIAVKVPFKLILTAYSIQLRVYRYKHTVRARLSTQHLTQ